jgi:hypothetical protein
MAWPLLYSIFMYMGAPVPPVAPVDGDEGAWIRHEQLSKSPLRLRAVYRAAILIFYFVYKYESFADAEKRVAS